MAMDKFHGENPMFKSMDVEKLTEGKSPSLLGNIII